MLQRERGKEKYLGQNDAPSKGNFVNSHSVEGGQILEKIGKKLNVTILVINMKQFIRKKCQDKQKQLQN